MNLGVIALFAPRDNAKYIMKEVVLYRQIVDDLSRKMESTLYSVLSAMVDAYFHDVDEYRRVMNMLKEKTSQDSIEKFESVSIFKNKVSELEKENFIANGKIADLEAEIKDLKSQLGDAE